MNINNKTLPSSVGLALFTVIILLMVDVGCESRKLQQQRREVSDKLADAVAKKKGNPKEVLVRFDRIATFEWDRLFFFTPYTDMGVIYNTLGYEWKDAKQTGIDSFDRDNLLVFTLNGKVVNYVNHPRHLGNVHDYRDIKPNGFSREEAVFEVRGENGDYSWLTLFPVTYKK
jgi:hypothetical protein